MSIAELVKRGVLDAQLAGLLLRLLAERVPVVVSSHSAVSSQSGADQRLELIHALLDETHRDRQPTRTDVVEIAPSGLWGSALLDRVRSLRMGDAFLAVAEAPTLRELFHLLELAGLGDDEIRALGVVVILDDGGRVTAAHYLRPAERDSGGHVQRRPPAVLAARHPGTGELEDFSWAMTPELAIRTGQSQSAFEDEVAANTVLMAT